MDIKHRFSGKVLFMSGKKTLEEAVIEAVSQCADLRGAMKGEVLLGRYVIVVHAEQQKDFERLGLELEKVVASSGLKIIYYRFDNPKRSLFGIFKMLADEVGADLNKLSQKLLEKPEDKLRSVNQKEEGGVRT